MLAEKHSASSKVQPLCEAKAAEGFKIITPRYGGKFFKVVQDRRLRLPPSPRFPCRSGSCRCRNSGKRYDRGMLLPQFWHLRSFGARHAWAARRVRCFILDVLRFGAAIILVGKKVINAGPPVHRGRPTRRCFQSGQDCLHPFAPVCPLQNTEFSPYSRFPCRRPHISGMREVQHDFFPHGIRHIHNRLIVNFKRRRKSSTSTT